jgi:hypothetical protein
MKTNVGNTDKIIRIILGVVILLLGWFLNTWWGLIGLLPLLTGLVGWCPGYHALKLSTIKKTPEDTTGVKE